jgi:hypothetical protein
MGDGLIKEDCASLGIGFTMLFNECMCLPYSVKDFELLTIKDDHQLFLSVWNGSIEILGNKSFFHYTLIKISGLDAADGR